MKILDPKIELDTIEVDFGTAKTQEAKDFVKSYGPFMPLIKIQDFLLNIGDIINFEYEIHYGKVPTFTLTVLDENKRLQSRFNDDELITGVFFLGSEIFYHKANLIFLDNIVDEFSDTITFFGNFHNPKLYDSLQTSFKDKTVIDIFKEISTNTEMGLYSIENENTNKTLPIFLNTNNKYIDVIKNIVDKYTQNNFWCIDQDYFLHIQNYDTLIAKEVDKYTIKNGIQNEEELPVIITNNIQDTENLEDALKKFTIASIIINNNTGKNMINTSQSYSLNGEDIKSHDKIGFGNSSGNTFSKFTENIFPFHNEIFKKEITGNIFELVMQTPIYEIFPFMVVETEIYNLDPDLKENQLKLNEKNSGKHIVMGYSMKYDKPGITKGIQNLPELIQTIKLI